MLPASDAAFQIGEVVSQPGPSRVTTAEGSSGEQAVSSGSFDTPHGSFGVIQLADPSSATAPRGLGNTPLLSYDPNWSGYSLPGRASGPQASEPSAPDLGVFSATSVSSGQTPDRTWSQPFSSYGPSTHSYTQSLTTPQEIAYHSPPYPTRHNFGVPMIGGASTASTRFIVPTHAQGVTARARLQQPEDQYAL